MSGSLFQFGEQVPGQPVPVLNERAVRAGTGLLFLFAMIAFMNAWLTGNFAPTRVFVVAFLIDFALRLFVNPRYAPSLIVGQWLVRRQQPEWTGAPQKRFAWGIGVALAFLGVVAAVAQALEPSTSRSRVASPAHEAAASVDSADSERCRVPEFAKAIGHDEMWKRHNNCL